jgi:hypothetical protein
VRDTHTVSIVRDEDDLRQASQGAPAGIMVSSAS